MLSISLRVFLFSSFYLLAQYGGEEEEEGAEKKIPVALNAVAEVPFNSDRTPPCLFARLNHILILS